LYYNVVKGDIVKYSNPHQIIIADGKAIQWTGIGPSPAINASNIHAKKYISFIIWKDFVLEYNSALNFEMKVQNFL